ncbi:hypothetical protein [Streptomyces sp. PA5.6]|uniref:hypothetical protein n=1 Tax=Streptomyces sp. PA5.6 TaxID=3035651 RepID=UPI0039048025
MWDQLHVVLLEELRAKNQLDWERAVIDSSHVRAERDALAVDDEGGCCLAGRGRPGPGWARFWAPAAGYEGVGLPGDDFHLREGLGIEFAVSAHGA